MPKPGRLAINRPENHAHALASKQPPNDAVDEEVPPLGRPCRDPETRPGRPLMPLRDHFRPPLSDFRPWDILHGGWPMTIASALNRILPEGYAAGPQVHIGSSGEVDVAAFEDDESRPGVGPAAGGATALAWAPPVPSLAIATDLLDLDAYEVRVHDLRHGRQLVAAVEILSPANKDRPEHRRAFLAKCLALLQNGVTVVLVDVVTNRSANLYGALLEQFDQADPGTAGAAGSLYAVTCRPVPEPRHGVLQTWTHPLAVGHGLPTLPLWVAHDLAVPLDLETTYEETCRNLRIT
jgi:hypothetical protein